MEFNRFHLNVLLRISFLGIVLTGLISILLLYPTTIASYSIAFLLFLLLSYQIYELFRFVSKTNKKLTRFLESIQYSDFTLKFHSDNQQGESFKELNDAFNNVLEAFHKERSEKQEHLQYLNTIVKHVNTGLITFNTKGEIELINDNAKKLTGIPQIKNIKEIAKTHQVLYEKIVDVSPGKSTLLEIRPNVQIALYATSIRIKNKQLKILVLQNIYFELQQKELESWQKLAAILRHEIMNSITPIASINATMQLILEEDLIATEDHFSLDKESVEDLQEGLLTVYNRTNGLINFIDAYRDYTNIPKPKFAKIDLTDLFEHIFQLMKVEFKKSNIDFNYGVETEGLIIKGDHYLLEMVLINLIKNAIEATASITTATIQLLGSRSAKGRINIQVIDNGTGIVPEAIDKILIPFYSTKKEGSGIGLSLSNQIMHLHNGTLTVQSQLGERTCFTLEF